LVIPGQRVDEGCLQLNASATAAFTDSRIHGLAYRFVARAGARLQVLVHQAGITEMLKMGLKISSLLKKSKKLVAIFLSYSTKVA
jgi:hypothetical protein